MTPNSTHYSRCNVLVVLYNNSTTIHSLLAGLDKNKESIETVSFVDNGSSDGTQEMLLNELSTKNYSYTFTQSTNVGFAQGMFQAGSCIENTKLPTLSLNPDLELAPGVVQAMINVLSHYPDTGIVTATLVGLDGEPDSASIRALPDLKSGSIYAVAGKLLPKRLRYNNIDSSKKMPVSYESGKNVYRIQATTGALMLVSPKFKQADQGLFDTDYWMYGEDLQLCFDAKIEDLSVYFVEFVPSIHLKGISSGWPRSFKANRAFHNAMKVYYRKNLKGNPLITVFVFLSIDFRLFLSSTVSLIVRKIRKIKQRYMN